MRDGSSAADRIVTEAPTFTFDEKDGTALRQAVARVTDLGYTEARTRERLGLEDLADLRWRALPLYRRERLCDRDPLALLIDLFLLQGILPAEELARLFDPPAAEVLQRNGLLICDVQGSWRARASLYPVGNRLVVSDHAWPKLPHPGWHAIPFDLVMSIGTDSRWLSRTTSRKPVGSALDLCTGSGVHALLAAAHAERVVAVDISPRAVQCTRFNARLFGAANLKCLTGDLYQPVGEERFDLITANPPFVPSPVHTLGFRDGGKSGEEVQRRIVEGLPRRLAPGGTAHIVTEIGESDAFSVADRVRGWLGDAPMDVVILRLREHSAETYAIGHAEGDYDFGEFLESVGEWSENLRQQGYARVVSVLLFFRWSDPAAGPPWTRVETVTPPDRDAGGEVDAFFAMEKAARRDDISSCRIRRAHPLALTESFLLGGELRSKVRARLLGKALTSEHWLEDLERDLLLMTGEEVEVSKQLARLHGIAASPSDAAMALRSLLRRGLINIIP
ncbi:methyltransferase [Geomesophilobacter sediminis]|uniref:Methyltransferase n=1 Tax=Geomesophilobacter sediminis TaxID=2798584 RepID=A0A8J7LV65_9BACT|nr:methyltransferase [Geomesophilobacter sediminis]MBJ6724600.1 methyltransferase [Geomesophilobacter sediminis]